MSEKFMVFAYLIIILCIFFALIGLVFTKKIYNPLTIFGGAWTAIFFSYIYNLSLYSEIQQNTFVILLIGLLFTFIGIFLGLITKGSLTDMIVKQSVSMEKVADSGFWIIIFSILSILISMPRDIAFLKYLLAGHSWEETRYSFIFIYIANETSVISRILYVYVANPVAMMDVYLLSYRLINPQKNKRKKFKGIIVNIIILLCVLSSIMSDGNRLLLFYFGISMFVNIVFKKRALMSDKKVDRKNKLLISIVFVIIIISFIYFTIRRGGFIDQITSYLGASIPLFDKLINVDNLPYTYGLFTFQGVLKPLGEIIEKLIGIDIFSDVTKLYSDVQRGMSIGYRMRTNSVATIFYNFYADFRIFGVIVFSLMTGFISGHIFEIALKCRNFLSVTLYSVIFITLFCSFLVFYFSQISNVVFIFYYIIIKFMTNTRKTTRNTVASLN